MDKFKKCLKWFFNSFIWLGLLLLIIDLVSKLLVVANHEYILSTGGIVLIPNFLRINYIINNKMVFGISLGSDTANRAVFCVAALLIVTGLIIFLIKKWGKLNKYYKAALILISLIVR